MLSLRQQTATTPPPPSPACLVDVEQRSLDLDCRDPETGRRLPSAPLLQIAMHRNTGIVVGHHVELSGSRCACDRNGDAAIAACTYANAGPYRTALALPSYGPILIPLRRRGASDRFGQVGRPVRLAGTPLPQRALLDRFFIELKGELALDFPGGSRLRGPADADEDLPAFAALLRAVECFIVNAHNPRRLGR